MTSETTAAPIVPLGLTTRQAVELTGIARTRLFEMKAAGELPAGAVRELSARALVWSRPVLERWAAEGFPAPPPKGKAGRR